MAARETKKTSVRLLSCTKHPVETIYVEWLQSRSEGDVPLPEEVASRCDVTRWLLKSEKHPMGGDRPTPEDRKFLETVEKTFRDVITMKIPVAETIDFVFLLEHCPIALREQIVRHRIGHRYGGVLGADIIPDLAESTFWSQTTRVLNMGSFASEGEYLVPESVEGNKSPMPGQEMRESPKTLEDFYHEQFNWAQSAYNKLLRAGVPAEDARNILPLGMQHRLTWKMNLSALLHVVSKRGCWIAQLGMWEPVIRGIIEELATKVHPMFRRLIDPPCFDKEGKFSGCVFKLENDNRVIGSDPYAPCPLYLHHHEEQAEREGRAAENVNKEKFSGWRRSTVSVDGATYNWHPYQNGFLSERKLIDLTVRGKKYAKLWGRDVWTGEPLPEEVKPLPEPELASSSATAARNTKMEIKESQR